MVTVSKKGEKKLAKLVREFCCSSDVKLVAITGSWKASAKIAIGTVLAQQFDIQLRNDEPGRKLMFLQMMGVKMP